MKKSFLVTFFFIIAQCGIITASDRFMSEEDKTYLLIQKLDEIKGEIETINRNQQELISILAQVSNVVNEYRVDTYNSTKSISSSAK